MAYCANPNCKRLVSNESMVGNYDDGFYCRNAGCVDYLKHQKNG